MKKRILLLIGYISVMMLCGKVIMGQHGVLLSQSHAHVHDENCEHDCVPPTKEQIVRQEAMLPQVRTQAAIRSVIPPGKGDTSQITPRRTSGGTTGNILGDKDVNNEFGAGETASIGENLQISEPSSGSIVGNLLVPAIQLGSEHSRNVVIHSYNAGGFAAGWINLDIHKRDQSAGGTCDDIGFSGEGTAHFSVGFQHDDIPFAMKENVLYCDSWETDTDINLVYWHHMFANLESATPPIPNKWTSIDSAIRKFPGGIEAFYEHYKNHNIAKNGGLRKVTTQKRYCVIPYTTTFVANPAFTGHAYIKGLTDNGVNLLQVNGDSVRGRAIADNLKLNYGKDPSLHAKEVASPAGGQNSGSLTSFLRPTTVSTVSNTYENIIFKNIDWWYRTYNVNGNYSTGKTNVDYWPCCHNDTVYATPTDIDTWIMLDKQGDTRLDAAVQLINGAVVCVEGDVGDETGSIASKSGDDNVGGKYKETNAMVVVPDSSRWAMRTKGDYHVNIYQEYRTGFSTRNNLKYFAADFPNPSADVYLKGNRPEIPVHHLITYDPVYHLGSYRLGTGADKKIDIPVPADTVGSALFGVYGNYSYDAANGANIHTADAVNNPGVIEVGPQTLGQEKFHVYSGGTIKNFESCNSPANNFPINFGVYGAQNTPAFKIDGDTALYILNYGNNNVNAGYLADINFANDAVANLNNAVSNAGAKGALHIQARGDVRFAGSAPPINMNVTANSNEVRILSDEASILINPAFTFDQADSNLILWAKGANSNSLSRSCITDTGSLQTGMLYFGGSTEITVNGKGLTFFRSEHDDVFFENNLLYKNVSTSAVNGEVMIQAGQDIYGSNVDGGKQIKFEQKGEKALLLEAKQTIHTKQDLIFEREQAVAGNIILKAGYASFGDSANINLYSNLSGLWGGAGVKGAPAPHDYGSRAACGSTSGGDIWLEGNAVINLYGSANTIHTVLRAKNSIYIDSGFTCNR
ncbi:MAG: hypothetical protein LBC19_03130, partial [Tannerella sp.]|nr:hypothetical protein [Tannerella sp.]